MIGEEDAELIYSIMLDMGFNAYKMLSVSLENILKILNACPDPKIGRECRKEMCELIRHDDVSRDVVNAQIREFGEKLIKWQTSE